jgi:hypothetical protein
LLIIYKGKTIMARLRKQVLGVLKGAIAEVVFKKIGNTYYVAARPESFIPGTDPASVFRRDQGAFVGKLASKIYSIGIIKKLWAPHVENTSRIYQRIWTENYHAANCNDPDQPVKMGPTVGFELSNPTLTLIEKSVHLKADPLGIFAEFIPENAKYITAAAVMVLRDSIIPGDVPLHIIPLTSAASEINLSEELNIQIPLLSNQTKIYHDYHSKKCYMILIVTDDSGIPLFHSSTMMNN